MQNKFSELFIIGKVEMEKIDDFIEDWHEGASTETLSQYLGLTDKEYAEFVLNGEEKLEQLLKTR